MSLSLTLIIIGVAAAAFLWSHWAGRREVPGEPSLVPHRAIQFVCGLALVLLLAHVVTLLTGHPLTGRLMGGR